jgi:hypothetical protein
MNTNTKTIDTEAIKQSYDLREYAGRYTTLRRESAHELAGPCPKCGGDDRFHCDTEWFFCRQCHTKRGDVIEFVTWKDNVSFKEAIVSLTNAPLPAPATRRAPTPKRPTEQPLDWQQQAEAIVKQAHARLFDDSDKDAEIGRNYLEHIRKLEPHTWQAFKLGFTPGAPLPGTRGEQRAPAIVVPWYRAGKVVAVRFRFLQWHEYTDSEGKERKEKQTALTGSSFSGVLYGEQAQINFTEQPKGRPYYGPTPEGFVGIESERTLIICEGELNNCSIWQAAQDTNLDVRSLGSESAIITSDMAEYAANFGTVFVWMDKGERATAAGDILIDAHPIESPKGQDANDMLQAGTLGGFLAFARYDAAGTSCERERLLWNLEDAALLWGGVDYHTKRVIAHIAKTLGKQVQLAEVRPGTWRIAL